MSWQTTAKKAGWHSKEEWESNLNKLHDTRREYEAAITLNEQDKVSQQPSPLGAWTEEDVEKVAIFFEQELQPADWSHVFSNKHERRIDREWTKKKARSLLSNLSRPVEHLICPTCNERVCKDIDHHRQPCHTPDAPHPPMDAKGVQSEEFLKHFAINFSTNHCKVCIYCIMKIVKGFEAAAHQKPRTAERGEKG